MRSPGVSRWMIGIPIVIFWMVMMGFLLHDELGVRQLESVSDPRQQPTEFWLGVSIAGGDRIGQIHVRQAPEQRQKQLGIAMQMEARMNFELLNKSTDLDLVGSVWRASEASRVEFGFEVRSSGYDFEISGEVSDGELKGEIVSAGESLPLSFPVDESLMFSSGFGSAVRFPVLEVGEDYRFETFDPLTMSKGQARVRCTARETLRLGDTEIETRRLEVKMSGLKSVAWIDQQGEVVRAETPVGLVMERITGAEARLPAPERRSGETPGLLSRTAIRPSGHRPFRGARSMTIQLGGLDVEQLGILKLPEDQVQTALGAGRYRLEVPAVPTIKMVEGQDVGANFLAPDAFVQSDHPKIQARANSIVGVEELPWSKARAIHEWVFTRLDKEPVLSIPSALEVLERRAGDCNEHTVLFTALARAVGVPTRIAIGLVWSDELDGFYYHAWPEVFLGDWIWMDPTLDQSLADATHIKLLNGGIETWPRLMPFLGSLEIEVLDID